MPTQLVIDNRYVTIRGADRKTLRLLEECTSYLVSGYYFSPAYRAHRWDGREHLLKFSVAHGYRAPIGLLLDIASALRKAGVHYDVDLGARVPPKRTVAYEWNEKIMLRDYQMEAIEAITSPCITYGSGILKCPIRSGKTKIAAGLIKKLGVSTLFLVPSQMLLHQTRESLSESLCCDIGQIGDSVWVEKDITVATLQSLTRARGGKRKSRDGRESTLAQDPRYKPLMKSYDLMVIDEVHHAKGEAWHQTIMDFAGLYRVGLSATAYLENERENEKGVIWLKACCGRIRIDIPTTRLIDAGYLMTQNVELHAVTQPNLGGRRWSQSLHNEAIYENAYRNQKVGELAREKVDKGLRVLIVSNRLNQIALLERELEKVKLPCEIVTGSSSSEERRYKVNAFRKGEVKVLLGTVFGEGIDIPEVECVINAEGGRDIKATVQRMRNLTPSVGKTEAVFIDFMDQMNSYFAIHSRERLETYRSEPAFNVRIIP
jgi:superfamily II DNA or RNA helicase